MCATVKININVCKIIFLVPSMHKLDCLPPTPQIVVFIYDRLCSVFDIPITAPSALPTYDHSSRLDYTDWILESDLPEGS